MGIFDGFRGDREGPALIDEESKQASTLNEVASRLDSIMNLISGLGTVNDPGQAATPKINTTRLGFDQLEALYRNNGYARRIVDLYPDDATRKGWKVQDDTDETDIMAQVDEDLDVVRSFKRGLAAARKKGAALVVPIIDEKTAPKLTSEEQKRQPLDLDNIIEVKGVHVFEWEEFEAIDFEIDPRNVNFRKPKRWQITAEGAGSGMILHHTRAIYIPGVEVSNRIRREQGGKDDSILQVCWDAIRNLTSVDQGGASLGQRLALNVIKVSNLKGVDTSKQEGYFKSRMKLLAQGMSILNMVVLGENDEFDVRATPVSGFRDLSEHAKSSLSAACGIPLAILYGEAPGGLNADGQSHREAFNNSVSAYQKEKLLPALRQFYRMVYRSKEGPTNGVEPESWWIEFEPLEEMSEIQISRLRFQNAQTDAINMQWGVYDAEHVAKSRYGEEGYSNDILPVETEGEVDMNDPELVNIVRRAIETGKDPMENDVVDAEIVEQPAEE